MASSHSPSVAVPRLATLEAADDQRAQAELVRRACAGDAQAFRSIYETHFDFILRSCLRLGLPHGDVEDALQETFLIASRKLSSFGEGRLSSWLFRIAANVVSSRHRKHRLRAALVALWLPRGEQPTAPAPSELLEQRDDRREAARRVGELLARMSPRKREVFALFELEGLSGDEIAERVGCPVATVWTRLFHARRDFERLARQRGLMTGEPHR